MDSNTENEKAFAFGIGTDNYDIQQKGMDLRDYFAAKAMQAILSNKELFLKVRSSDGLANNAYSIADAMMKERNKEDNETN